MAQSESIFDVTRRNDPAYWAAAAVVADRAGDAERANLAREQLQRLGYRIENQNLSAIRSRRGENDGR
jgi:hypothetical protein